MRAFAGGGSSQKHTGMTFYFFYFSFDGAGELRDIRENTPLSHEIVRRHPVMLLHGISHLMQNAI